MSSNEAQSAAIPGPTEAIGAGRWTLVASKTGHDGRWSYRDGWTQKQLMGSGTIITMQRRTGEVFNLFATVRTRAWDKVFRANDK
jgi:hypothetical protein